MRTPLFALLVGAFLVLASSASAQDISAEATYGSESLDEGFLPDPYEIDITAGGSTSVDVPGCGYGMIGSAPDMDLYYDTSGSSDLYIYATSGSDTTILVNSASGDWYCDDDSYGDGDPIVVISGADAGLYNIWVGTYGDEMAPATLYISEVDPR